MMTRREALRAAFLGAAALAASPRLVQAQAAPAAPVPTTPAPTGPFVLPPLPYDYKALEPYIDAQTMQIHHDKHHAAYVANLNKAVAKYPDLQKKTVAELVAGINMVPEDIRTAVRNNGGGHYNHSQFWQMMQMPPTTPVAGNLFRNRVNAPSGDFVTAINAKFGSLTNFQQQFTDAALKQFGSGWAWLSLDPKGGLMIESTPNQDSPLMAGRKPLLGIDVWEHAYYLKYQNRRPEYIAAWFNVVNWNFVAERHRQGTTRA